ncbi:MOSC domain-containing protein [Nocardioides mesophilus]|uniref:MOSC domain-containing protein n=1 Tax=Nocardioides mesophilus TaxID=433659 RepID=A0A7G9RG80_9ACTN|nr:MOSC N-terminal beta barrel domain-containing protein [Nocardioides mesophilus]QNN54605.1 MOSC domain-containing protein [Nocardioides mesophilus]
MKTVTPSGLRPALGRISSIWRYPVKSLVGEEILSVHVDERGLQGDRLWAVRDPDGRLGSGKSTRRFSKMDGLLQLAARADGDVPALSFPDGRVLRGDDPAVHAALSAHLGRPVALAREQDLSHFDEGPVHLVTTASLRALEQGQGAVVEPRRLRPNLVLETDAGPAFLEDDWVGRQVEIGERLVLAIRAPMPRCVMITLPQAELAAEPHLLKTLGELNDAQIGVVADVVVPGPVAVGDQARLVG